MPMKHFVDLLNFLLRELIPLVTNPGTGRLRFWYHGAVGPFSNANSFELNQLIAESIRFSLYIRRLTDTRVKRLFAFVKLA